MTTWPDWSNEIAVIVGTGPSTETTPLHLTAGRAKVIAVKEAWRLVPWADALYGLDVGWWLANKGAKNFMGMKFSPAPQACKVFNLHQIKTKLGARIILDPFGTVGCGLRDGGGHSGWQAINLAVQFGARRIVLVGFEMTLEHGNRFNGASVGVGKVDAKRVERWRREMDAAADEFTKIDCAVINATPGSALRSYVQADFADIFLGGCQWSRFSSLH